MGGVGVGMKAMSQLADARQVTLSMMRDQQDVLIEILSSGMAPLDLEMLEGLQDFGVLDGEFRPTPLGDEVGRLMSTGFGR